ncbi:hypothetical protein E2542_SST09218 [Spatholobus suberectus]|nr:hypothetical protein E2542_SST09218 [Spatholobus suberectus]
MCCGVVCMGMEVKTRRCLLGCGGVHEKGHGSAVDMARRNWTYPPSFPSLTTPSSFFTKNSNDMLEGSRKQGIVSKF